MEKKAHFHQANITVMVSVIDGNKSTGLINFDLAALLNTDEEWNAVYEKISARIQDIETKLNNSEGVEKDNVS